MFSAERITPAEIAVLVAITALIGVLPIMLDPFDTVQVTLFLVFSLLALSLDLIWGMAGVLSFGQAALFGVGAYAYGIVGINTNFTIGGLLAGMAAASVLAAIIGYVAFYGRVSSIYFAVITLTATLILAQVAGHTAGPEYAVGSAHIGGYNGMINIPSLGPDPPGRNNNALGPEAFLRVVGWLLLGALILARLIGTFHFGRTLIAIRENERRVELTGYDVRWRKLAVFTISGALAGLAGGLFASWGNFVNPEEFSLPQSALVVIWVLVGGRGTLYGPILGAIAVQYLTASIGQAGASFTTLVLGLVLVAIVLLFRRGLAPGLVTAALRGARLAGFRQADRNP